MSTTRLVGALLDHIDGLKSRLQDGVATEVPPDMKWLGFGEVIRVTLRSYDSDPAAARWVYKLLSSLGDVMDSHACLANWSNVVRAYFQKSPAHNHHQFGFLIAVTPDAGLGDAGKVLNGLVRGGSILCGLREFKRRALAQPCELDVEIVSGHLHNQDAYGPLFTQKRALVAVGGDPLLAEVNTEKSAAELQHPNDLSVAVLCFDCLFALTVRATDTPASVTAKLLNVQEQAAAGSASASTGNNAFSYVTYLKRPDVMAALSEDTKLRKVWEAVQSTDLVVSLFPDVRASDLDPEDPYQGGMNFLRQVPKVR
jgi:hypothetical protein